MTAWPDDITDRAVSLWNEGKSGEDISRVIGKSREAVVGKLYRMGLTQADASERKARAGRKTSARAKAARGLEAPARPVEPQPLPNTFPRPWLTRQPYECGFPVGGFGADTLFCCAPVKPESRYCAAHHAIAYVKPEITANRLARSLRRHYA